MTEMPLYEQVLTIAVCVLATMATRMIPFFLFRPGKNLPAYIQYLGKALSLAVTVAVHVWRRNMLLSMAAGTACCMALTRVL